MNKDVLQTVSRKACYYCEYCLMPKEYYLTQSFPFDHVIALQHSGTDLLSNLALSCLNCNSNKGPTIAGRDPKTRKLTPLFHRPSIVGLHTFAGELDWFSIELTSVVQRSCINPKLTWIGSDTTGTLGRRLATTASTVPLRRWTTTSISLANKHYTSLETTTFCTW